MDTHLPEDNHSYDTEATSATRKAEFKLNGVAKTLLTTLLARARDSTAAQPVLHDPYAKDVLERLDFDSSQLAIKPTQIASIALRTSHFDGWTSDFLQCNSDTTDLHLACGLDSRMDRVRWGENTRWFDIDLPEVIEHRRKVQSAPSADRKYFLLGVDVLDESWMHSISSDGPVLVVIEGLLCYQPEDKVIKLLKSLCQNSRVGEILFECITPTALRALNRRKPIESINDLGVEFYWAVDLPETLEHIDPALKLVESVRLAEASGVEMAPLGYRALMYVLSWIPKARDSARFLRFRFGDLREL